MDQDSPTQQTPPATPAPASTPAWAPDPVVPTAPVPSQPVTAIGRRGPSARVINWLLAGALVFAVAGIAFAAGRITAPEAAAAGRGTFPGGGQAPNGYFGNRGNGNGGGGFQGGAFAAGATGGVTLEGTVDAVSATTLTLKLASGQTIQVALDPTTTYHAQTNASSSDVVTGGKVLVRVNLRVPDGSETVTGPTARDITVEP